MFYNQKYISNTSKIIQKFCRCVSVNRFRYFSQFSFYYQRIFDHMRVILFSYSNEGLFQIGNSFKGKLKVDLTGQLSRMEYFKVVCTGVILENAWRSILWGMEAISIRILQHSTCRQVNKHFVQLPDNQYYIVFVYIFLPQSEIIDLNLACS